MMLITVLFLFVMTKAERAMQRGYYDLQMQGALTPNVLRRLQTVLGYEPNDFLPPNGLRVWIDSSERGERVLDTLQHLRSMTRVETTAAHRDDIVASVNSLRVQHRRSAATRANNTHAAQVFGAGYDSDPLDDDDEGGVRRFGSFSADSFERLSGGEMTVRLRVVANNVSMSDLVRIAQAASRTRVEGIEEYAAHYVLADVHSDDAGRVADELMKDKRVGWVELQVAYHPLNKFAAATVRSGVGLQATNVVGLDGKGQVLSVSDTGVEVDNCFFFDNVRVPTTSSQSVPADTGHRKIRAYWSGTGGDFRDIGSEDAGAGHGTHVCGSAVGAATSSNLAPFNGGAPAARLAVVDLLSTGSRGGFLAIPADLGSTFMKWSYDVGARVHSASWGGDAGGRYTSDEQSLDLFAYKNRNFLIIYAAGNDGPRSGSISSPANAKNVLAVGATMNGVESVQLAQTPSRVASDYTPEWLSPFSSRGSRNLYIRKPDVVAPGGPYIWSAASDSTTKSTCTSFSDVTTGLYGTSMATPHVAAAALQLRQYFVDKKYPNSAGIPVDIDTSEPTASLLRAMLVASAQPLLGVYPRQTFANTQARIDASGHGRVALGAVLDSNRVQLAVLSNENEQLAVQRQRLWRWCVELVDKKTGVALPHGTEYGQVSVVMSYADYPSTPTQSGRAAMVNDLRLKVIDWQTEREFKVNDQDNYETRSTNERVVVGNGVTRFSVAVVAETLGFGDSQSYSLVLALQRGNENVVMRISGTPSSVTNDKCILCETTQRFSSTNDCSTCGNGIVEPPLEQCDSSACCDHATCKLLDNRSQCTVVAGECKLRGQCVQGTCLIDDSGRYGVSSGGGVCEAQAATKTNTICSARTVATWRQALSNNGSERALIDKNAWTLCCSPLWAAIENFATETLGTQLTHEYVAAQLNVVQRGALSSASYLLQLQETRELLEANCGHGLLSPADRSRGAELLAILQSANRACVGEKEETGEIERDCESNLQDINRLNTLVCSSGGTFNRASGQCACHSNRQPGEPNCAHLACSGNGVSVFDYDADREVCLCLDGWTGATCSQCAAAPAIGLARHCLGIPLVLRTTPQSPQRVPILVQQSTVAARLAGRFYGRFASVKLSDSTPGANGLDCWCRSSDEKIDWKQYDSHADALAASFAQRAKLDAMETRALSVLAGQPVALENSDASGAVVMQIAQLSGADKVQLELIVLFVVIVLTSEW